MDISTDFEYSFLNAIEISRRMMMLVMRKLNSLVRIVKKSREDLLKKIGKKFLTTTSVQGIARVMNGQFLLVQCIWIMMALISFSFGIFNIYETVGEYFSFKPITNVERIDPSVVVFPAITVCAKRFYQERLFLDGEQKYFIVFDKQLSHFLKDSFFKDQKLDRDLDFEHFQIPKSFGDCLRFNGKKNAPENVSSISDRFQLNLDVSSGKHSGDYRDIDLNEYMEVYITDNYLNSYIRKTPVRLTDMVFHYNFDIIREEIEDKLGYPFNDCSTEKSKYYHQMNCIEQCVNIEIAQKYNCSIPSYYKIQGLNECGIKLKRYQVSDKHVKESPVYEFHIENIDNLTNEFYSSCSVDCPKECHNEIFSAQLTQHTTDYRLFFSISGLSSLRITQIPRLSIYSFISNIGGILGLFIGITFLSIVEVFELFIELIFVLFVD